MKWNHKTTAEKWDAKVEKQCKWHKWFAWYPVKVLMSDGSTKRVWLETIGRKKEISSYSGDFGAEETYIGNAVYCEELDLISKTFNDNELVDNTRNKRMKQHFQNFKINPVKLNRPPPPAKPPAKRKLSGP